ncbi:MAG: hypothetical protein DRJ62_00295 [Thermoprotei archaeon]|nr:MAG: hypothetical protein DRJ62_00295 [Thermoprotei archaeon]
MAKIKFVTGHPASIVTTSRGKRVMTISDIHIGLEYELRSYGFNLPSQTTKILERLEHLLKKVKPDLLVILGDVKHAIAKYTRKIRRDVETLLKMLIDIGVEVKVVLGNHDGSLKVDQDLVSLEPPSGTVIDDVGFIHGHAWPRREVLVAELIVMGHLHPSLPQALGGQRVWVSYILGKKSRERVAKVLKSEVNIKRLIVHPAFNEFLGAGGLSEESFSKLSPLFRRCLDPSKGYVYTLNGVFIGRFSTLSSSSTPSF